MIVPGWKTKIGVYLQPFFDAIKELNDRDPGYKDRRDESALWELINTIR